MSDPAIITPLSGEIMSGTSGPPRGYGPLDDVVDAEFITLARPQTAEPPARPQVAQPVAGAPVAPVKAAPVAGLDILGKSSMASVPSRSGIGFWAAGLLAAAAAFWMAGGHSLARNFSFSAPVATGYVQVASVRSEVRRSAQGAHLVIDGTLENNATIGAMAPDLDIEVAAMGGGVTRYRLGNGGALIEPHGARSFSSRLTAPATGVRSVSVTVAGGK